MGGIGFIWLRLGIIVSRCEYAIEPLGFISNGVSLDTIFEKESTQQR